MNMDEKEKILKQIDENLKILKQWLKETNEYLEMEENEKLLIRAHLIANKL